VRERIRDRLLRAFVKPCVGTFAVRLLLCPSIVLRPVELSTS
jgi:hypothetical protein